MSQSDQPGSRTPESARPGASMSTPYQRSLGRGRGRGRARTLSQESAPVGRREPSSSTSSDNQFVDFVFISESDAGEEEGTGFGTRPTAPGDRRRQSRTISRESTRSSLSASLSSPPVADTAIQKRVNPSFDPNAHTKLQTDSRDTYSGFQEVIIEVSGITEETDKESVMYYFEDEDSGGEPNSVKECKLAPPGRAYVTFHELRVVDNVMAKQPHVLDDAQLSLKRVQEIPEMEKESMSILLSGIPQGFDRIHIKFIVKGDVSVTDVVNGRCTVHFPAISSEDLEEKITSIKTSIGGDITVTRCQNTLRITKIGKRRTTQFLKNYFSNESRSGGGELVSVPTLLEDGKVALVSFKQSQALERVLAKSHEAALGETAHLDIEDPLAHLEKPISHMAPVPSHQTPSLQPVEIPVGPLVGLAIHQCPKQLHDFGKSVNVTFKVELEHIVVTPSEGSVPDWQSKCKEFLSKKFSKCEMNVPNEIKKEMRKKFGTYKHVHAFISELRNETDESVCYILAGEVEVLKALQHHKNKLASNVEEIIELSCGQYDFVKDLKINQLQTDYPSVQCVLHTSPKLRLFLKGPLLYVEQVKEKLAQLMQDLKVFSVEIDQKLVDHFATNEGQKQLKEYITTKGCPMVPSFQCHSVTPTQIAAADTVLSLVFICESAHFRFANSVANDLKRDARCAEIRVPENLSSLIDRMKEYQGLVSQLRKDHPTRIVFEDFEKTIFVYGISENVISTVTNIEAFIKQRKLLSAPLTLSVSQLQCKAFQKRPQTLEKELANCNPNLSYTYSEDETEILVTSKVFIEEDWKKQLKAALQKYTNMFSAEQIIFNPNAVQEISKFLVETEQLQRFPFAFDLQVENTLVEIVGETSVVEKVRRRVREISHSYDISTRKVPLQPALHAYLTQVQLEKIKINHPDLTISLDANVLIIQGPKIKLIEFEEHLSAYLKYTSISLSTDILLIEFFSEGYGKEFLKTILDSKANISFAIFHTTIQLDFLFNDTCEDAVRTLVAELQSMVTTKKIPLPESLKQPISQGKAKLLELYMKLEKDHNVLCSLSSNSNTIEFGGKKDDVLKAVKKMSDFIVEECTTVRDMQLSRPQWKLIHKDECWIKDIKQWLWKVDVLENDSKVTQVRIHLKGEDLKVIAAHRKLLKLRDCLKTDSIKVLAPEACRYFQSESTKTTILPGIESHYSVSIETILLENAEPDVIESASQICTYSEFCRVSTRFEMTKNIVTFKVHIGDLTDFEADVIVNPANGELKHSGGLAAAIVKKGGQEIQKDCFQYVPSQLFELEEGEVFFSTVVGRLPCKAIVHAVGPRWQIKSTDHEYEKSRLKRVVKNSLAKAKKYSSIAFPAISSGIFHYPINQCALIHVEASMNFFKTSQTALKEVSFVVLDQAHARAFQNALSQFFPGKVIALDLETRVYTISDPLPSPAASKVMLKETQPAKPTVLKLPCLLQGDLFSAKVVTDVYICTANTNLDLSRGVIAQRMSKLAGPSLQMECTDKGGANVGDVVVTGPGNLKCQYVFHAVASNHKYDKDGKILQKLLQQCFEECEKHQVDSIAFPAIGPGGLGYPVQLVAKIMISESCKYLETAKNTSFQIYLVIFDKTQHKVFQAELESMQTTSSKESMKRKSGTSASKESKKKKSATTSSIDEDSLQETPQTGLKLLICGFDGTQVSSAAERLTQLMRENFEKDEIEDEVIRLLKPAECLDILRECKALGVECRLETDIGRIQLKGNVNDITKIKRQVHNIIHRVMSRKTEERDKERQHQFEVEKFYQSTRWQYMKHGSKKFEDYDKEVSYAIEQAFQQFQQDKRKYSFYYGEGIYKISLDFKKQEEKDHVTKQSSRVRRFTTKELGKRPDTWEDMPAQEVVICVDLQADDVEYKHVLDAFSKTMVKGSNYSNIVKIQRVQNPKLYGCYQKAKEEMERANPPGHPNEWQLFHGTDVNSMEKINANGFHPSYAGKHAKVYGAGTYFSRDASFSASPTYSQPDSHGYRYMYYAKVLAGQYTVGNSGIVVPPPKNPQKNPNILFDSIVNSTTTPTIFVVGPDAQSYPEYLIIFKCSQAQLCTTARAGKWPDTWDVMPAQEVVICVDLQADDVEYKHVVDAFSKTMVKGSNFSDIVKIQRVQNPKLYGCYQKAKEEMERVNPPGHPNERQLFHGTDVTSMEKINVNGFNRSYAGKHAKSYGVGTYFARDASYSASPTYSKPNDKGHKHMYYARVLVGEYTVGKSSMMVPPPKDPQKNPNILFDSLVNNTTTPTIFVVGPDAQSYPEYLITFK